MDQQSTTSPQLGAERQDSDEIDLMELWGIISEFFVAEWKLVVGITVAIAMASAAYTYTITPLYKATAIVQVKGKASKGGGLLDLAAAAGMPVLADETADAAIGKLKSTAFARSFIEKEKLTEDLLSDKGGFGFSLPTFGDTTPPKDGISDEARTLEKARKVFSERVQITTDSKTQLLTLVVTWEDPVKAAELANKMVQHVNEYMRQQAIETSQKSVGYLTAELGKNSLVPVQQAIFRLIEEQVKTQMGAGVNEEFALRFIDPASPPIQRDTPKRRVIVSMSAALGFIVTAGILFLRRRLNLRNR